MAACIEDDEDFDEVDTPYFFVCGWMRLNDAKKLAAELDGSEPDVICVINDDPEGSGLTPPVSIRNKGIFKPYEMYTKMYGLPNYREFDPTVIIALLYSFTFGAMFGDLGHGLVLLIGGALLYFVKRAQLAGIISFAGFFASIFGLLYGSFFGFEDVIPTLWLKPREAMSQLNFIGRLNTVFAVAVAYGMILMLVLIVQTEGFHGQHLHVQRYRGIPVLRKPGARGVPVYGMQGASRNDHCGPDACHTIAPDGVQ